MSVAPRVLEQSPTWGIRRGPGIRSGSIGRATSTRESQEHAFNPVQHGFNLNRRRSTPVN